MNSKGALDFSSLVNQAKFAKFIAQMGLLLEDSIMKVNKEKDDYCFALKSRGGWATVKVFGDG